MTRTAFAALLTSLLFAGACGPPRPHLTPFPDSLMAGVESELLAPVAAARTRIEELSALPSTLPLDLAAAWGDLGRLCHARGLTEGARIAYGNAALLSAQDSRWARLEGHLLLAHGDAAGALAAFDRALRLRPEDRHAKLGRERALGKIEATGAEEYEEDPLLAEVTAVLPPPEQLHAAALGAAQRGDWPRAATLFSALVELVPENADLRTNLAVAHLKSGDLSGADAALAGLLSRWPEHPEAWYLRGAVRSRSGDEPGAIASYRRALTLAPGHLDAGRNLANALLRSGLAREALEEYDRLAAAGADGAPVAAGRAAALVRLGQAAEALASLKLAYDALGRPPLVAGVLARLLATAAEDRLRDGGRALELAAPLVELDPSPLHLETLAMALAERGDFAAAIAVQERALAAANQLGANVPADMRARLGANLARYRVGEPCRDPALG